MQFLDYTIKRDFLARQKKRKSEPLKSRLLVLNSHDKYA
ncbi:hypothetical protein SCSC_0543 [Streptococcus constellatus subsp. constellatus]|nr:hypothetical protein SCSC_0543 [Streptococcus constellatus subsp. constellatus]